MRYWLDTEFIDDGRTIDLISIGIVAEDGREYYAISKEFQIHNANEWVKENVLKHLPPVPATFTSMGPNVRGMHLEYHYPPDYKTRLGIALDIHEFIGEDSPEFWAYYAAYDWVVFCQLFGRMVDLPPGWPMYCRDIRQLADDLGVPELPKQEKDEHHALADARWCKQAWEFLMKFKEGGTGDPGRY